MEPWCSRRLSIFPLMIKLSRILQAVIDELVQVISRRWDAAVKIQICDAHGVPGNPDQRPISTDDHLSPVNWFRFKGWHSSGRSCCRPRTCRWPTSNQAWRQTPAKFLQKSSISSGLSYSLVPVHSVSVSGLSPKGCGLGSSEGNVTTTTQSKYLHTCDCNVM